MVLLCLEKWLGITMLNINGRFNAYYIHVLWSRTVLVIVEAMRGDFYVAFSVIR